MNYHRKSNKDNFQEDIKDLNNKIDTIYTSLSNIIEERNNLLQIFNSRIPNENIFNKDIKVDSDNKYQINLSYVNQNHLIFTNIFFICL